MSHLLQVLQKGSQEGPVGGRLLQLADGPQAALLGVDVQQVERRVDDVKAENEKFTIGWLFISTTDCTATLLSS